MLPSVADVKLIYERRNVENAETVELNISKTKEFPTFCYSRKTSYFALLYILEKFAPL